MNLVEDGAGFTSPVGSITFSSLTGTALSGKSISLSFRTSTTLNLLFMIARALWVKRQMDCFRPIATSDNHIFDWFLTCNRVAGVDQLCESCAHTRIRNQNRRWRGSHNQNTLCHSVSSLISRLVVIRLGFLCQLNSPPSVRFRLNSQTLDTHDGEDLT